VARQKNDSVVSISSSSTTVMETLQWLRSQNFTPVALHPHKKAAVFKKDDQNFTNPSDDLWRKGNYGVGVLTGGHGPMDVDLDCGEAVYFAPRFLPPTDARFGRATKTDSHWLYRSADFSDSVRFVDAAGPTTSGRQMSTSMIVELRGTSGDDGANVPQTVMPGNMHEGTGELIRWSGKQPAELPIVDHGVLRAAAGKIAAATLIVRHLWNEGVRNQTCLLLSGVMSMTCEWPLADAKDFVQAILDYTGDDDRTRLANVENTYRRLASGKKVAGAGKLRELCGNNKLVDDLIQYMGGKDNSWITEYNERFAVVSFQGKCRVADTNIDPTREPILFTRDDFCNMFAGDHAGTNEKGRPIIKPNVWFMSAKRRTYDSLEFWPGEDEEVLRGKRKLLNSWTGWATKPVEGDCSGWLELLRTIICGGDEDMYQWMLQWFAQILIEPQQKPMTSPVMIGEEGAGKTLLLEYFSRIMGDYYLHVTQDEQIHGNFNGHMERALLLHSEEAVFGGDRRHGGIMRALITDQQTMTTKKNFDSRRSTSYLRLIHSSNEMHAVAAATRDRRYTILNMERRSIKHDVPLRHKILKEMYSSGPAALHFFLTKTLTFNPEIPRINVKNAALAEVQAMNVSVVTAFWRERLEEGSLLPAYLQWAQHPADEAWPPVVSSVALYNDFVYNYVRKVNYRGRVPSDVSFFNELYRIIGFNTNDPVRKARPIFNKAGDTSDDFADASRAIPPWALQMSDGRMSAIMNMPDLEAARAAYDAHMGVKTTWPQNDDEHTPEIKPVTSISDKPTNNRF
jgi:hypothetical protein